MAVSFVVKATVAVLGYHDYQSVQENPAYGVGNMFDCTRER